MIWRSCAALQDHVVREHPRQPTLLDRLMTPGLRPKLAEPLRPIPDDILQWNAQVEAQKEAQAQMMASFSERQKDLGFVSGIKGQTDGQQLAGVNYSVINGESEKAIKLQEEMRDYLRSIDEKKWTVELPDAS